MTKEEAQEIFETAKRDLPSWEVVMNSMYTDQEVRDGVLCKLLKMFYGATGNEGSVIRHEGESFEDAINGFLRDNPGSYIPYRDIEDVVETAMAHRQRAGNAADMS